MQTDKITYLFYRHFDGTATPVERLELARLLQQYENEEQVKHLMLEAWETFKPGERLISAEKSASMLAVILSKERESSVHELSGSSPKWFLWKRIAIAVAILVTFGTGWMYYSGLYNNDQGAPAVVSGPSATDFVPGGNKALLTLEDGNTIELDNASQGLLATHGATRVLKTGEDQVTYQRSLGQNTLTIAYHTLKTPRGGQYQLVLPDGSKVWLNAASSIRYPTVFDYNERKVTITGEAFFEIASIATDAGGKVPFIVVANNDMEVEVLGTQFNINAYCDEAEIKTTLLEGQVIVHKGNTTSLLKPGQQADVSAASPEIRVKDVNTEQAIAWKKGYFQFNKASLQEIIRQLSKWYDVEFQYEGTLSTRKFSGEIPREATLLQVLEILELSKIAVNVEGKEIIIKSL